MAHNGETATVPPASIIPIITPAKLHTIIAGLWLCLFMSAMDTTIVTTALIKISNGFNALEQGPWLITAYLLTYNCKSSLNTPLLYLLSCSVLDDHRKVQRHLGPQEPTDLVCRHFLDILHGLWSGSNYGTADRVPRVARHWRVGTLLTYLRVYHEAHLPRQDRVLLRYHQFSLRYG